MTTDAEWISRTAAIRRMTAAIDRLGEFINYVGDGATEDAVANVWMKLRHAMELAEANENPAACFNVLAEAVENFLSGKEAIDSMKRIIRALRWRALTADGWDHVTTRH